MKLETLLSSTPQLPPAKTVPIPVVLSSRIRLARNLNDYSFPGWAAEEQRKEVSECCLKAAQEVPALKRGYTVQLGDISELQQQLLVERHLMSRELMSAQDASIIISRDQGCSVMINEEDHLRIQVLRSGFNFSRLWKLADTVDTLFEQNLDYAFSSEFGYLTACPTNVGTGMRASVMMHLPGLVIASQMEKVVRAVGQLSIAVRGIYGEGSEANGSIFQISNQQTLGESEEEVIRRLTGVLKTVVEQEKNARIKLIEEERCRIVDKMGRALGLLQGARMMSSAEAMNLLSLLRLAVDLEFLAPEFRIVIDQLFIQCQPAHVRLQAGEDLQSEERDFIRATMIRDRLQELPVLNFGLS